MAYRKAFVYVCNQYAGILLPMIRNIWRLMPLFLSALHFRCRKDRMNHRRCLPFSMV